MLVHWSPQRSDRQLSYEISGETITATLDGETDVFDFSDLPDGEVAEIISTLDPCPVLDARRVDGELQVTLLRVVPAPPSDPQELEAWNSLWTNVEEVR